MKALVIERESLPPVLSQYFDRPTVSVKKRGDRVILYPKDDSGGKTKAEMENAIRRLCGCCSDGRISVEDFLRQRER